MQLDQTDQKIIELLSEGKSLSEIRTALKEKGFNPREHGSVPKRLEAIKKYYGARSLYQLGIKIQKIKWENEVERLIQESLKEGFSDGKKAMKKFAFIVGIPAAVILCLLTYLLTKAII